MVWLGVFAAGFVLEGCFSLVYARGAGRETNYRRRRRNWQLTGSVDTDFVIGLPTVERCVTGFPPRRPPRFLAVIGDYRRRCLLRVRFCGFGFDVLWLAPCLALVYYDVAVRFCLQRHPVAAVTAICVGGAMMGDFPTFWSEATCPGGDDCTCCHPTCDCGCKDRCPAWARWMDDMASRLNECADSHKMLVPVGLRMLRSLEGLPDIGRPAEFWLVPTSATLESIQVCCEDIDQQLLLELKDFVYKLESWDGER